MNDGPGLDLVLAHIKEQRGFDFTSYKRASLARRVLRRMEVVGIDNHEDYLDHLIVHPDEFTQLLNTVLINVTAFFRDPEAWQYLREELLPPIVQRRDGEPIRVWVAGCASGEEAYTMAMVLADLLGVEAFRERVKIYATDVDEEALAQARAASYDERSLAAVPADLRARYFEPSESRFVFRQELRRAVIFGRNDLVQDAPISHVDVLSCRNTLMYFNAETQARILGRMHFALRPDGVLFLGKAEVLLAHSAHFRPVELKRRFFGKIAPSDRQRQPVPSSYAVRTPDEPDADLDQLREAALMSTAAAQIVLDNEGRLAVSNHRAMQLFGLSARDRGRPIQDLEVSYRPTELRALLSEAVAERRVSWVREVELPRGNGDAVFLDVQVVPLADDTGTPLGATVLFHDVTQPRQLQQELLHANRALGVAYEELQSTNEELESMNEELQSMNDELQLTNEALRDRQGEVDRLNRLMVAVLASMSSGVAVVNADLEVLAWNSRAEDLWGVRGDEALGQHIMDLDIGLPVERLGQTLRDQLAPDGAGTDTLVLQAINRRGRSIVVEVTVTPIGDDGASRPAAMLSMDVVDQE